MTKRGRPKKTENINLEESENISDEEIFNEINHIGEDKLEKKDESKMDIIELKTEKMRTDLKLAEIKLLKETEKLIPVFILKEKLTEFLLEIFDKFKLIIYKIEDKELRNKLLNDVDDLYNSLKTEKNIEKEEEKEEEDNNE
mgnify:CR=1 FL=1